MRIKFVVTGDLERGAIVESVQRFFPSQDAQWLKPRKLHGATSYPLVPGSPPNRPMQALAKEVLTQLRVGDDPEAGPPDLLVLVDDLELANQHQPTVVVEHFRRALELEIATLQLATGSEARLRSVLKEKCSFHFLAPMVESYFFAEPAALVRAGAVAGLAVQLVNRDIEDFESCDPAWLATCAAANAKRAALMPWWRHERHPKHYLEHLLGSKIYDETLGGADALRALDWPSVAATSRPMVYATSLFEDLADFFGVPNPLGGTLSGSPTYPARHVNRAGLLIRNL